MQTVCRPGGGRLATQGEAQGKEPRSPPDIWHVSLAEVVEKGHSTDGHGTLRLPPRGSQVI